MQDRTSSMFCIHSGWMPLTLTYIFPFFTTLHTNICIHYVCLTIPTIPTTPAIFQFLQVTGQQWSMKINAFYTSEV